MEKKLQCIMLIDDNPDDNFFHERVLKKSNLVNMVIAKRSGIDALDFLKFKNPHQELHPELIFLDINMPGMNGWEFLQEYRKLEKELQSQVIIIMLTTSDNPQDIESAKASEIVTDFKTKPLTKEMLMEIIDKHF
jgi:CheY-like chemotaxis protein